MQPYAKGDRVSHSQYGPGTLTDINEHHTVIDFDNHGTHRFVTRLVVLESTNEPPPPRASRARRRPKSTNRPA